MLALGPLWPLPATPMLGSSFVKLGLTLYQNSGLEAGCFMMSGTSTCDVSVTRSVQRQQQGHEPLSLQGEAGRPGLLGSGRCPVSFHGMGRCAGC